MTEVIRAAAGIFAALAPFGLMPAVLALSSEGPGRAEVPGGKTLLYATAVALVALLVTVLLSDPFLGLLDVVPESFQLAAALIMLPLAAQLLWTGRSLEPGRHLTSRPWLMPLAVPGLAGPATLAAVVAYAARYGEAEAAGAIAVAVAAAVLVLWFARPIRERIGKVPLNIIGRLSGAFIVIIAFELAVDGIRSV